MSYIYSHEDNEIASSETSSETETDDFEDSASWSELNVAAVKAARMKELFDRETVLEMFQKSQESGTYEPEDDETGEDAESRTAGSE